MNHIFAQSIAKSYYVLGVMLIITIDPWIWLGRIQRWDRQELLHTGCSSLLTPTVINKDMAVGHRVPW